jgi:hypothetical protein
MVELLLLLLRLLLELPRLELWVTAPILLLLWSTQLSPRWGIHHTVLGRSTARTTIVSRSRHVLSLILINLSNGLHHSLLINGRTRQLIVRQANKLYQPLLQLNGESCKVLSKGVELPRVVKYTVVPLLKVQELLQLCAEQTRR